MWLNTKAGGEQVLMNHKQPQDSGAPVPHITDCEYYYYYNHHSFVRSVISQIVWLLPKQQLVIWGLISMCKQKVCPTQFSQQSSHLGEALQVWTFLCRLGRDEKIDLWMRVGNSRTYEAKDSWDKDYLWTKGQTKKKKKIPNNLYSIYFYSNPQIADMLFFDTTSDKDNPAPCYTSLKLNCYLSQDRNLLFYKAHNSQEHQSSLWCNSST